ncbi:unnamed protein product [Zymoseptoria tritici ST99CH_1A5]|uniref:F-box domain-containing protein n=1 Tax=Zymoseptoria tritici ST99CH_1A5 TaxID=1276529 RepID=A0A1Y6LYS7_ZYMTR|nr:unnamed protein product [Zymoseptoria tritici ST99CH_1A5]
MPPLWIKLEDMTVQTTELTTQRQEDTTADDEAPDGESATPNKNQLSHTSHVHYHVSPSNQQLASPPPERQDSHLLSLPAELKLTIYELVICTHIQVNVGPEGYHRPGLLATCKEIRADALSIFCSTHTFCFEITEFDFRLPLRFQQGLKEAKLKTDFKAVAYTKWKPNWANLIEWLKLFHSGEIKVALRGEMFHELNYRAAKAEVAMMFRIVEYMDDLSWERMEQYLCKSRPTLAASDPRWEK